MTIFVLFIFGAVIIGAGAMLAPAWPTTQPRIGLNAALALGIVIGGALFYAMLFGWNTLVIDYLLFALVTGIFLFGTLSYGQTRAEKKGQELLDKDQGWPGPNDLLFYLVVILIAVIPALALPVPLDTDAQGFGYLALTARTGQSFFNLAPFHPEIDYLYAPGFPALIAYLSQQLKFGIHEIQLGVAAVLYIIMVLVAYDFGAEWKDKRLGRATALCTVIGMGLFTAYMDSHYTSLLALIFSFAFLTYSLRWLRYHRIGDMLAAGLMLGVVVLCHPDTTIILGLGFAPWLLTMWGSKERPSVKGWLGIAIVIPIIALLGITPWLLNVSQLLGSDIVSPFERDPNYWQVMILYQGILIVPIALVGAVVGLRKRDITAILSVGWLLLILDFSTTGIIESIFGGLLAPLFRYDYPFSIAWHGPIIPYAILGGIGLLWLWDKFAEERFGKQLHRLAPVALAAFAVILLVGYFLSDSILAFSKNRVGFYGAFSSEADVAAMTWLRENTETDVRLLNHPAPHEADWVPVISERDSVYYRPQPFFRNTEASEAEQELFLAFWEDPANPGNLALLEQASIDYVIVPQLVTNPESIETMFRWRAPFTEGYTMNSDLADAPYLELVFDQDGAQVYQVVSAGGE